MPNDYFQFKQFIVNQDKCAMKVGTDGVLLGAWASIKNAKKILDIGTGTGLIALMLAQRSKAKIIGIEIDKDAANQAKENILKSPWNDRIEIIQNDFIDFLKNTHEKFDLIVTNPPYFENALHSPKNERTIARHNKQLNFELLISGVSKILNQNGVFSLILPAELEKKIENLCFEQDLFRDRICFIKPTHNKNPKRIMMEFGRKRKMAEKTTLIIEDNERHKYSADYIALTKDFYLKF